jgi:hypothetical protein
MTVDFRTWSHSKPIPPQSALLKLAEIVREHIDKRRRAGPKWKFRLAPDLVVQIQPMLPGTSRRGRWVTQHDLSFEGIVYQGIGLSAATFSKSGSARHLRFVIDKDWSFRGTGLGPLSPTQPSTAWRPEYPRPLTPEQADEYCAYHHEEQAARYAPFLPLKRSEFSMRSKTGLSSRYAPAC